MTETAHTPLPWVANDKHSGANPWRIETDDGIWANDGWIIAECCGPDAEANARFIVQAVDSHHRLVEALEEARTELSITRTNIMCEINRCADPRDSRWEGVPEILKERIAKIDAALKEAGRG